MERFNGLALFVDLFFVISGFIITHYYQDKVGNIKQFLVFLQRRIGRLFPLHWLTLCIMASVFWISAKLGYLPRHSPTLSPACLAKTAMLIQELIPCDGIYVNAVTWSISVEMSMYVLFPILVLVSMKLRVFPMVCAGMILLVISFKSIWHGDFLAFNWEDQNSVVRIFPSFLIGMSFCHYRTLLGKMPQASKVQMILLAGTIIAMMNGAPMLLTLFLVYAVVAASVAADMQRKASSMVKVFAPFAQLTYSIYMWHSFFILIIMNIIGDKLLHSGLIEMMFLAVVCYTVILIWSVISFKYIETPARRWIDGLPLFTPNFIPVA